jgi:membrane-bound lytic murein transglycosylase A
MSPALRTLAVVLLALLAAPADAQIPKPGSKQTPAQAAPAIKASQPARRAGDAAKPGAKPTAKQAATSPEPEKPLRRPGDRYVPAPFVNELGRPARPDIPGPLKFTDSQLEPLAWSDLDQWAQDNHVEAFTVFRGSCRAVIGQARAGRDERPILPALAATCRRAMAIHGTPSPEQARSFFETNFRPVRIVKLGDAAGFLTGYYEPIVDGSRFPTQIFNVPVYRRPPDLIPPAGYVKGQGFPNTGKSMRKDADGKLVPYWERGDIENGVFDGQRLEICWLKDPIDLFFIQIQGSGRVRLEDGTMLRINYDAHNGHSYTAIGRILIERGQVPREEMSMERIRTWMNQAGPLAGKELRSHNKSYVFFRIVGLTNDHEPAGAQGVPLTPQRSIAVDRILHVYGSAFYIEADLPIRTALPTTKYRKLMIAQDTGSAIVGPARADLYFGAGDEAGRIAGRFRHPGRFALLVPRELDPVAAGARFPLPNARPDVDALLAQRQKELEAEKARAQLRVPLPPRRGRALNQRAPRI